MPLTEQRRQQLDSIVQQMVSNGEPDGNIQFVVNDFKTKYENEGVSNKQDGFFKSIAKTIANPFLRVGLSAGRVGQSIGNLAKGNVNEASDLLSRPANIPFFGRIDPAFTGQESTLEATKKIGSFGTQIASTIVPVGKVGTGIKGLAGAAGRFGTASALGDAGMQLESDKPYNLGQTVTAFGIGASLPILGKGVNSILKKAPQTAWSKILQRTPTASAKNPELPQQIAKEGIVSISKKSLLKELGSRIQQSEVALDDVLSKQKGQISGSKVASYLDDLKNTYNNIPGEQSAVDVIDKLKNEVTTKGKLSLSEANELKRSIYGVVSKSYGKGTLEIPAKTEAQKVIASGLKQEIEKLIPEAKNINQKQAIFIQAKNAIEKSLNRAEGKGIAGTGIGAMDVLLGGVGSFAAGPLAAAKIVAGKKVAESTLVLSGASKILNKFNSISPTKKMLFLDGLRVLSQKGYSEYKK